ncbi:DUF1403 domain-containing protein (plasmid) [Roseobacter denitrificans]|uniref:DUF1403 family protein n=1 Tax=Roseobacter denitrificans (strain ATCC 33942 / OCh 114) TaxID=375451 RepID=Q07GR7_ROSDO|nr:DUF1403 family protein [Roseobacter denitrificans]ABI93332.1 conserved hypothetical protein [Roseobacter denitrificans OCh 114]AVL51204.1 DUF1403 domain-containing protein [Roseobacter denitrificans]SFG40864.1 Protein of unknown function [Roseobacter denitrificans OCh 114]
MTFQPAALSDDLKTLPKLPGWVTSTRAETLETVAFRSGAALTVLDGLVSDPKHGVPVKLFANHLALKAATATSKLEGRLAREADIRDAYYLTPPGEARGPDGDLLAFWREAAQMRMSSREWQAELRGLVGPDAVAEADNSLTATVAHAKAHGPLAGCVSAMRAVLEVDDRGERIACLLSDVVLARALNWTTVLPVSGLRLTKGMLRDLVADGQGAELKVQQRLLESVEDTIRQARDLSSKSVALKAVAPKLRAKGSDAAVALFLSEGTVAPPLMLSPMIRGTTIPMTDRAARRFCDRLVELGVARELTGRPTFRLYGIAS